MATYLGQLVGAVGTWPYGTEYPQSVTVAGRAFRRARFRFARCGVAAQYREAVPFSSRHLLVYGDGTWCIDHVDAWNPDGPDGSPLRHLFADFLPSRLGALALGALLVGLTVALCATQDRA